MKLAKRIAAAAKKVPRSGPVWFEASAARPGAAAALLLVAVAEGVRP